MKTFLNPSGGLIANQEFTINSPGGKTWKLMFQSGSSPRMSRASHAPCFWAPRRRLTDCFSSSQVRRAAVLIGPLGMGRRFVSPRLKEVFIGRCEAQWKTRQETVAWHVSKTAFHLRKGGTDGGPDIPHIGTHPNLAP